MGVSLTVATRSLPGGIKHPEALIMIACSAVVLVLAASFAAPVDRSAPPREPARDTFGPRYEDRSATHLPATGVTGRSMDAHAGDLDDDGDLDIVVAREYGLNVVFANDGSGQFAQVVGAFPGGAAGDSEDVAIVDFDGDGLLDVLFVSEDTFANELYFGGGDLTFVDASARIPVAGTSNAMLAADIDGDHDIDVLIGNAGQNVILINDGRGFFTDETASRLPVRLDQTQDLELGDVDDDGDQDLVVANEDDNRLLINTGGGVFVDAASRQLPLPAGIEETREADLGDIDGDGDLDLLFVNTAFSFPGADRHNRLLINDGHGGFTDVSEKQLPAHAFSSVDGDFLDLDADGDLDITIANVFGGSFQAYRNDGAGHFTDATSEILPATVGGDGIDVEAGDFNGDGYADLYLCTYAGFADQLLLTR